jgi:hypothetical protein
MELFIHFLAQGVVVCSECKHAVLPSHIDAYLKDERKHKAVKADRERIVQEVQAIRGLKTKRAEAEAIPGRGLEMTRGEMVGMRSRGARGGY